MHRRDFLALTGLTAGGLLLPSYFGHAIAAEQLLGEVQAEARSIVLAQPGIKNVRWELDRNWLAAHQIEVPQR